MLVVTRVQWGPVYVTVRDWRPRVHVCPWPLLKRRTAEHGCVSLRRDIANYVLILADIRARFRFVLFFATLLALVLEMFPILTILARIIFSAALVIISNIVGVVVVSIGIVIPFVPFPILGFGLFATFPIRFVLRLAGSSPVSK